MSSHSARAGLSARDQALRRYMDRHYLMVVCLSLGYAVASCFGLILMLGFYAALGGDSGIAVALGLSLWLLLNGWVVRRFMAFLRGRAAVR